MWLCREGCSQCLSEEETAMLLMEYCNDLDHCNPCAKSREGSWHGSSDESGSTRKTGGWSKQSPSGSTSLSQRKPERYPITSAGETKVGTNFLIAQEARHQEDPGSCQVKFMQRQSQVKLCL